jgi:hypothetical protein
MAPEPGMAASRLRLAVCLTLVYAGQALCVVVRWDHIRDYLTGWQVTGDGIAKARFAGVTTGPEHRPGMVAAVRPAAVLYEKGQLAWIEVIDTMGPPPDSWDAEDLTVFDRNGKPLSATSPSSYYAGAREGNGTLSYVAIKFAAPLPDPYDMTIRLRLIKRGTTTPMLTFHAMGKIEQAPAAHGEDGK